MNSVAGFDQQHIVINTVSKLLKDIFGMEVQHARAAIGLNQLPNVYHSGN
ncbi:hypothetical protein ACPA31_12540 [Bacillus bombysepticus]